MAQLLHSAFAGLSLVSSTPRRQQPFVSNGTVQRLAMNSKKTYQVEVGAHDETCWFSKVPALGLYRASS